MTILTKDDDKKLVITLDYQKVPKRSEKKNTKNLISIIIFENFQQNKNRIEFLNVINV